MGGQPGGPQPTGPMALVMQMLPFILIIVVFYVFMIRPQQKKQREKDQMLNSLKKGDRVVTAGGILGEVQQVKENTVVVRIADNVKIELQRGSVAAKVGEGNEEAES
jgi:preprotein translocase subunit YajC